MSMHLLHRLSGQGANPSGTPAEHSGTKQRTEEAWYSVLKATRHHADSRENEPAEADNCTCVYSEGFEGCHQRLGPGEVHCSLSVSNACEGERDERWAN
jgi:hypothetical protein